MASGSEPPPLEFPVAGVGDELRSLLRVVGPRPTVQQALPLSTQPAAPQQPGGQQDGAQQPTIPQPPGLTPAPGLAPPPGIAPPPGFALPTGPPPATRPPPPRGLRPPGLRRPPLQQPELLKQPDHNREINPHVDGRPLSPWAERYGPMSYESVDGAFKRDTVQHSCFAPDHPVFYGDDFDTQGWGQFQSGDHKDRFFMADNRFKHIFQGNMPWQLGPLNRLLRFNGPAHVPGGNFHTTDDPAQSDSPDQIFQRECFTVDEDTWFDFFKKDRWYDVPAVEPILSQDKWTVEDPMVWGELRIAIELANRMLNSLIDDKHDFLLTILYGKFMPWKLAAQLFRMNIPEPQPNARVLLSPTFFKKRWTQLNPGLPCGADALLALTGKHWRQRLKLLLTRQEWALYPTDLPGVHSRNMGATYGNHLNSIILLNVCYIRPLLRGTVTLAERCWLYVLQAQVILHELSHSICNNRMDRDASPALNMLSPGVSRLREAYVDFGGSAEMGYYMEKMVFGGSLRVPYYFDLDTIPMLPHVMTWPFLDLTSQQTVLGLKAEGHPDFAPGVENKLILIPSIFASTLMSDNFWSGRRYDRKSDNFFHMPLLFCSRSPHDPSVPGASHYRLPVTIENRDQFDAAYAAGRLSHCAVDMLRNWELRERLWSEAHLGWYEEEKSIWERSPWGFQAARATLMTFNAEWANGAFRRSVYTCALNADRLTFSFAYTKHRNDYIMSLVRRPGLWVWHAVGLLMNAAIPIRLEAQSRPPKNHIVSREMTPSASMQSRHQRDKKFPDPVPQNSYPLELSQTVLYDPIERDGEDIPLEGVTHMDFLDHLRSLISLWADARVTLSRPWLGEILRVEAKLRARWEQLEALMPDWRLRRALWADGAWDFDIPEYDPDANCQWDPDSETWVNV
ncbi:hypothetical protein F4861DRAFT_516486 [Xylaria intraflava]|nr:hypothetical protein F4861DRAFT_516486 [Xylaria intraflava]